MQWWQILLTVLGSITGLAVIVGAFLANARNKYGAAERSNYKEAVDSYKKLLDVKGDEIDHLKKETHELRTLHAESMRQIGLLQGQVDAYSKLPLQDISRNQRILTQAQLLLAKHMGVEGVDILLKDFNSAT